MHKGYNLTLELDDSEQTDKFYKVGNVLHERYKASVKKTLASFMMDDGELNAFQLQENWFPEVDAHVFISHSHKNEKLAVALAGILHDYFGIKAFIDSCAWGCSTDLLRLIDDEYCNSDDGKTYSYQKRNASTAHVHMMLSVALSMMIDKAECLIFLNTPDSISPKKIIQNSSGSTKSPWIYAEIAMTKLIQRKSLDDHRGIIKKAMHETRASKILNMMYGLNLDHLIDLDDSTIEQWLRRRSEFEKDPLKALDALYALK